MTINEVLSRIEDNGFEAYIVGGYVRDYLLGIDSTDIDICTNATIDDLIKIYEFIKVEHKTTRLRTIGMLLPKAKINKTTKKYNKY